MKPAPGTARRRLASAFLATRIDSVLARLLGRQGLILGFHRVGPVEDGPLAGLSVTPEDLVACVALLRRHGYEIVALDDAARRLGDPGHTGRFAVLTFDDGYRDNAELLPGLLERVHAPACVYVTSGFIDRTAPMWWYSLDALLHQAGELRLDGVDYREYAPLRDHLMQAGPHRMEAAIEGLARDCGLDQRALTDRHAMDWPALRHLARSPWITIGSHGVRHLPLAQLSSTDARAEIEGGAARLAAELGAWPSHLGFPFGDRVTISPRDLRLAQDAGFVTAATSVPGPLRAGEMDLHALPRMMLGGPRMTDRLRLALCGLLDEAPIDGTAPDLPHQAA